MNPEQKRTYLQYLTGKIESYKTQAAELEKSRNEADGKMQSRHDTQKEDYALSLSIVLDLLDKEKELQGEVKNADVCQTAVPGASLVLSINGEEDENFLLMNTPGTLPDTLVITPTSPIGESLVGKKVGEKTVYSASSRVFNVVLKKIE